MHLAMAYWILIILWAVALILIVSLMDETLTTAKFHEINNQSESLAFFD